MPCLVSPVLFADSHLEHCVNVGLLALSDAIDVAWLVAVYGIWC